MSRPPNDPPPPDQEPEPVEARRISTAPLIWLLVLIALGPIIWYLANQREPAADQPAPPVPAQAPAERPAADGQGDADAAASEGAARAPAGPAADTPRPADRAAEPLTRPRPDYPVAALRARSEGTVLLRVEVDARGRPAAVEIERSSRSRDLDRAARDAVLQWTFDPAIEDGRPVASTVTVPVDFRVEEQ